MGSQQSYRAERQFRSYLYTTISQKVTINEIKAKMVKLKSDKDGTHSSLPKYAETPDMYLRKGDDGYAKQAKLYVNRKMTIDFDWGHNHKNKDTGEVFAKGVVHVQVYHRDERMSNHARLMTDAEIAKYGPILKKFCPNVKSR